MAAIDNLGMSQSFTYDKDGNMLSGPDMTDPDNPAMRIITYNSDNMPVQITHSVYGTTIFVYDGTGGRAKKIGLSGTIYYV